MTRTIRDANGREFPAYEPPIDLRKQDTEQGVLVNIKHIPEQYAIKINGLHIECYADADLFGIIADIEAEMLELERINNRPIALAKLLDDKRRSINHIIAWMNCRK